MLFVCATKNRIINFEQLADAAYYPNGYGETEEPVVALYFPGDETALRITGRDAETLWAMLSAMAVQEVK